MKIGGLQKVSLIDYPAKISAVVFTQGCNYRCPYCHNPELVDPELFSPSIAEDDILRFLETRRGKLDAVSITGGEPTLQEDLAPFITTIRKLGFEVKLDTNGSRPEVLSLLIQNKLVNFIAMDVKAPFAKYSRIAGVHIHPDDIRKSISLILASGLAHEFRTTVVKSLLSPEDILAIADELAGAKRFALQKFRPTKALSEKYLAKKTHSDEILLQLKTKLEKRIPQVIIR